MYTRTYKTTAKDRKARYSKTSAAARTSVVTSKTPPRFQYSKKTFKKNSKIANVLKQFSELKYRPWTSLDEAAPAAIQVGALAYQYGIVGGLTVPAGWTNFNPLGGFQYSQGTGNTGRDGRYMFLNKSTINMSIHMNSSPRNKAPTQFRMIVFKARRGTTPTGVSYDPNQTLFLAPNGNATGAGVGGINGNDLRLQPLNKRDWIIISDRKFTLQAPMAAPSSESSSFQGKYPNFKQCRITLNQKAKALYDNSTNEPIDFDFHYGIVIYAMAVGRDELADGWEVNFRGTTTAYDN